MQSCHWCWKHGKPRAAWSAFAMAVVANVAIVATFLMGQARGGEPEGEPLEAGAPLLIAAGASKPEDGSSSMRSSWAAVSTPGPK